jgi:hypothetical protein
MIWPEPPRVPIPKSRERVTLNVRDPRLMDELVRGADGAPEPYHSLMMRAVRVIRVQRATIFNYRRSKK